MKQSVVLTLLAVAGCMRGTVCKFSGNEGTAKIDTKCVDGTLIGVDGDALLTFTEAPLPGPGNLEVDRLDLKLGTRTTLTTSVFFSTHPAIVANGEVYFLSCADDAAMITPCEFQAVPTAGGPPRTVVQLTDEQLAPPFQTINGFVVDASSIYWISNTLWSAPLAGGTPTRLADASNPPSNGSGTWDGEILLSVDETGLYATSSSSCSTMLEKIALDGSAQTMINGTDPIGQTAARDGVVYWMEPSAIPENGSCAQGGGGSGGGCGGPEYGSVRFWSADAGVQTIPGQIDGHGALVVDNAIAWTVGTVGAFCQGPSANAIVELVGGVPTTIATAGEEGPFYGMVTDGTNLYAETRSSIWRVPFR